MASTTYGGSGSGRARPGGGFELFMWFFMRISGLVLLFLAIGHLVIMHMLGSRVDYDFVVRRYAVSPIAPLWRLYDLVLITLALIHGMNGLRQILDEYVVRPGWRVFSHTVLYLVTLVMAIIGLYTIVAFQPSPAVVERVRHSPVKPAHETGADVQTPHPAVPPPVGGG